MNVIEDIDLERILLYGNTGLNFAENRLILKATTNFILSSKRFADNLT